MSSTTTCLCRLLICVVAGAVVTDVSAQVETLSDPNTWSGDFMRGAMPTPECQTDTIENVRERFNVDGPFTVEEYEQTVAYFFRTADEPDVRKSALNSVSTFVRSMITEDETIYSFRRRAILGGGELFLLEGYLVARGECVVHVEITSIT